MNVDFSYGSLPSNLIIHIPRVVYQSKTVKKSRTPINIQRLVAVCMAELAKGHLLESSISCNQLTLQEQCQVPFNACMSRSWKVHYYRFKLITHDIVIPIRTVTITGKDTVIVYQLQAIVVSYVYSYKLWTVL